MDANGQRFWLLRGGRVWQAPRPGALDVSEDALRLASTVPDGSITNEASDIAVHEERLEQVPVARDAVGGRAWYEPGGTPPRISIEPGLPGQVIVTFEGKLQASSNGVDGFQDIEGTSPLRIDATDPERYFRATLPALPGKVLAASSLPGDVVLASPPAVVTDLAMGPEGWLYIVCGGRVLVQDVRGRYPAAEVAHPGLEAWRIAVDPNGGAWILDRRNKQVARLTGQLWPKPRPQPADAFVPLQENPDPLRLVPLPESQRGWLGADEDPVALACSPGGQLIVLLWGSTTSTEPGSPSVPCARVRHVAGGTPRPGRTALLKEVKRPFSIAWVSDERFAVMAAGIGEALVYTFVDGEVLASSEFHPLRDHTGGPFLHGLALPVEYPALTGSRPLVSLSLPAYPSQVTAHLDQPIDCGEAGMAWHRLYVEAEIPPGTSFTVWLAASDTAMDPEQWGPDDAWHPHHFGPPPPASSNSVYDLAPRAAWVPSRSEIPGFDGFLCEEPERERAGLFTVLVQRSARAVRTLRGRYLNIRVELRGDNRATPCLHALRAYGPRFSYLDRYLPATYREQVFGEEANRILKPGTPSTRADFLGRFLANVEGILTPLEDKVADAWLLTDPTKTPDARLEWLAAWIGVAFEPWYPAERRREHLRRAPELFRRRGTFRGLQLALDVATGGGVLGDAEGRRRIVLVENYWMRRTMATILGVNLDKEFDPLLAEPVISGNSKVGRTLILNEDTRREVLALFDASTPLDSADAESVASFFGAQAHRATVLVHPAVGSQELTLVERIVAMEAPAHVLVQVRRASHDFMVGLAALMGVDTYLLPPPVPESVVVDASALGEGPRLTRPPSLDPRIEGTSS